MRQRMGVFLLGVGAWLVSGDPWPTMRFRTIGEGVVRMLGRAVAEQRQAQELERRAAKPSSRRVHGPVWNGKPR